DELSANFPGGDDSNSLFNTGSLFFKTHNNNNPNPSTDPVQIQNQLKGSGHSLDSGTRSSMGSIFGQDFSNVRVHSDAKANNLSQSLNARAFTVGQDIAFGSGEYKPGSLVGDALIAHELAHVVQQGNKSVSLSEMPAETTGSSSNLEQEADLSAVNVVMSLWSGTKNVLSKLGKNTIPQLKSGLRLQRCDRDPKIDTEKVKELKRLAKLQKEFLEERDRQEKIKEEEKKQKQQQEAENKAAKKTGKPPRKIPPVDKSKIKGDAKKTMKKTIDQNKKAPKSTEPWDKLVREGKDGAYLSKATSTIQKIYSTVESLAASEPGNYAYLLYCIQKTKPTFSAAIAKKMLKNGWYAVIAGSAFEVSMGWIDLAAQNERNVF
ncbi:MAG: DUF4157 domain-containing protein, partial [Desulfobacteraceae bacterium]|nr:DUF4157 domain-containing protein [Desulfobacteraceae bacterium]